MSHTFKGREMKKLSINTSCSQFNVLKYLFFS